MDPACPIGIHVKTPENKPSDIKPTN